MEEFCSGFVVVVFCIMIVLDPFVRDSLLALFVFCCFDYLILLIVL